MPDVPDISVLESAARLGLTLLLCGLIGLERELRDQAAGLRTHILVGVGSTLFTMISAYGFSEFREFQAENGGFSDPGRIAAQIVTGIGFLGAGAIMRQGITVRGLTTAAALWISAAVGMAVGAGYYEGALITTVLVLVALVGLYKPETRLTRRRKETVVLEFSTTRRKRLSEALELLAGNEIGIEGLTAGHDGDSHHLRIETSVTDPALLESIVRQLQAMPDVTDCVAHAVKRQVG